MLPISASDGEVTSFLQRNLILPALTIGIYFSHSSLVKVIISNTYKLNKQNQVCGSCVKVTVTRSITLMWPECTTCTSWAHMSYSVYSKSSWQVSICTKKMDRLKDDQHSIKLSKKQHLDNPCMTVCKRKIENAVSTKLRALQKKMENAVSTKLQALQ